VNSHAYLYEIVLEIRSVARVDPTRAPGFARVGRGSLCLSSQGRRAMLDAMMLGNFVFSSMPRKSRVGVGWRRTCHLKVRDSSWAHGKGETRA
jgi:hypothetical protein